MTETKKKKLAETPTSPELPDAALEGPAPTGAYTDADVVDLGDGKTVSMNELMDDWNKGMGEGAAK